MKKWLSLLAVASLLTLGAWGCGSGAPPPDDYVPPSPPPVAGQGGVETEGSETTSPETPPAEPAP